jgi:hypothetical protein
MATESTGLPTTLTRADRIDRVPFGDRWLMDAWELFPVPAGFGLALADMTQVNRALRILRNAKIPATFPHLIVRAVGICFALYPGRLQLICNYRRLIPGSINIGLSMAGQTTYAPVVVIPAVDQKPLAVLIPDIIEAIDAAAAREGNDIAALRRFVVPFRFIRRWLLRILSRSLAFRTRIVGHFQVTCVTNADIAIPFLFYSSAIISAGAIRDRVIAVDGQPVVRPTVWLGGVGDHVAADGQTGADALSFIKYVLESDMLVKEAEEAAALKASKAATGGQSGDPRLAAPKAPVSEGPQDGAG